ncbi:Zn-dependent protease [Lacticaseibacillus paracasei]|uniref:Zn-dependent protease n=1 Tax=Lacticaseibacillus paracasei TaxID=1597 RepID=UPI0018A340C4|nr:Zn-dependent protease [Lacticaseibacillus paracasei]MDS0490714.1 Zn-dependent protease [Lacticaseibacillus paracasei]QOP47379.1 Zn-dependent protease [Lacticaseibacillus paracasei]UVH22879.1 Zn-dependent protease [Lacticaseibacillus paracasei]
MRKRWRIFLSILTIMTSITMFNNANQVDAKVKFINDLDMFKNEPENARPSKLSFITTINKHGTMIYDDDAIKQKDVITAAAAHWNRAVGVNLIMSYQKAKVAKAAADVVIKSADLPNGVVAETGYNGIVYEGWQNIIKINDTILSGASFQGGFVQAVAAISHEMGHALGINHDSGALMGNSGNAQLAMGILPDIPEYNINAVGDILKNLNQLYAGAKPVIIPNMTDGIFYRGVDTTMDVLNTGPVSQLLSGKSRPLTRDFMVVQSKLQIAKMSSKSS